MVKLPKQQLKNNTKADTKKRIYWSYQTNNKESEAKDIKAAAADKKLSK
jgi:hypothetical protein